MHKRQCRVSITSTRRSESGEEPQLHAHRSSAQKQCPQTGSPQQSHASGIDPDPSDSDSDSDSDPDPDPDSDPSGDPERPPAFKPRRAGNPSESESHATAEGPLEAKTAASVRVPSESVSESDGN